MGKKEIREGEIIAYIFANMGDDYECETDFTDLPTMSRATAFRVFKGLDVDAILLHVEDGRYRIPLPPSVMRKLAPLVQANIKSHLMSCLLASMQDDLHPYTRQELERHINMCASCPPDTRAKCFKDETVECPFQSQMGLVSNETRLSDLIGGSDQEEKPVSNETGESGPPEREEKSPPQPPPRTSARALLKRGLEESRAAAGSKPPTVRAQAKELKVVWDEQLVAHHGDGFVPPKWGPKEWKNIPSFIQNYGLELTKKAVLLYFEQWNNIKAENPWIDASTPTTGLFLHFQDRLFAAVQGKGRVVGERASKRTADEPDYEVTDGQDLGQFPTETPHKA